MLGSTSALNGKLYHPEIILAGRRVNNFIPIHIASEVIKLMLKRNIPIPSAKILILGLTFKENCPDTRNSKVINLVHALRDYCLDVDVYDPWVDIDNVKSEFEITCLEGKPELGIYSAIVLAVAHNEFIELGIHGIKQYGKLNAPIFDVKSVLPDGYADGRL